MTFDIQFDIQEVVMQAIGIRYMLEQWITPDGKTISARPPPAELLGHRIIAQYCNAGCSISISALG